MTSPLHSLNSNAVIPFPENFYARWRARKFGLTVLRDGDVPPPERLLRTIWQHQRLCRDQLTTLDGKPLRVLHPGFISGEGGPDFRGAVIQIGDASPQAGDVEVDVKVAGWRAHGHDRNPNFKSVILHVVWETDKTDTQTALALRPFLDSPLPELSLWLEHEPATLLPEDFRGKCSAPLSRLEGEQIERLLREAAQVRLQSKAAQLQARARHAGWEQALWEGLFRALGYKHNAWPMHALAESRRHWAGGPVLALQARALGLSGLLPTEPGRRSGNDFVRRLWDCWWRERDGLAEWMLPRAVWRLHGLRPANHPHRRLALAAHWLGREGWMNRLVDWCAEEIPGARLMSSLEKILAVGADEFWSWHWTLKSPKLPKPQALLGEARVNDLAVNVILPWLWTRAHEGGNVHLRAEMERRYFVWPASEDNAVLKLARQRLLNGRRIPANNAAMQQGLMQVVRDFCDHSNAVCDQCPFPELVSDWQRRD